MLARRQRQLCLELGMPWLHWCCARVPRPAVGSREAAALRAVTSWKHRYPAVGPGAARNAGDSG